MVFKEVEVVDPDATTYDLGTHDLIGGKIQEATPVPVPASMLLLGSGLVGLVGFRRRRSGKQV